LTSLSSSSDNGNETLANLYKQTMARLERITKAGYAVKVKWKCEFEGRAERHPALQTHPAVQNSPLVTHEALHGRRTEAVWLYCEVKEGEEIIQYLDAISLYPWVCKHFKFPFGHPTVFIGNVCEDISAKLQKK
jgi:hypothetical protein